ncbi:MULTISPECIES: hypothetical protein [unclassified Streptomyces]|uniref:hypothetical protein n=1 Tax=unclassified Streptomyces TaxID=2593676 RepID=UPI000F741644|nr:MULTISPECIES: hypothetical protein [unclassified Streptomyces]
MGKRNQPVLLATQLVSFEEDFRPSDRLRYRTASPLPSYPDRSGERVDMLSRSTPGLLWPAWAARLSPGGTWDRFLRPAFSACVLITGTRIEIDTVAAELGKAIDPDNISRILQVLEDTPSWPQITAALTRLADHLARNPPPIDYRHRRGLDYTGLLPDEQWEEHLSRHRSLPRPRPQGRPCPRLPVRTTQRLALRSRTRHPCPQGQRLPQRHRCLRDNPVPSTGRRPR